MGDKVPDARITACAALTTCSITAAFNTDTTSNALLVSCSGPPDISALMQ